MPTPSSARPTGCKKPWKTCFPAARHASPCKASVSDCRRRRCGPALGESRYLAPGELGRRLGVTKSRVTAVTTGLLRQGLIEKHPDPADARVTLLSLTPAGKRMREDIRTFMVSLFQSMLDRVEPERREAVLASLEVLRHCMDSARAELMA